MAQPRALWRTDGEDYEMIRIMPRTLRGRTSFGVAALLFTLSAVMTSPGWADDTPEERATLKGIKAVKLVVNDLHPDAEADGLSVGQLQSDVELLLRRAGIPVSSSAKSHLNVTVNTSGRENGWYFHVNEASLTQPVVLACDRKTMILAATWRLGNFGDVRAPGLPRFVRNTVAEQVERFIQAYREQHPKR